MYFHRRFEGASLGVALVLLPVMALGQVAHDGTYTGKVTASGRCGFDTTDMSITVQGAAVSGYLNTPRGQTKFAGTATGNDFSIPTTGASGNQVLVAGIFASDGSRIDATANGGSCAVRGPLMKKPNG